MDVAVCRSHKFGKGCECSVEWGPYANAQTSSQLSTPPFHIPTHTLGSMGMWMRPAPATHARAANASSPTSGMSVPLPSLHSTLLSGRRQPRAEPHLWRPCTASVQPALHPGGAPRRCRRLFNGQRAAHLPQHGADACRGVGVWSAQAGARSFALAREWGCVAGREAIMRKSAQGVVWAASLSHLTQVTPSRAWFMICVGRTPLHTSHELPPPDGRGRRYACIPGSGQACSKWSSAASDGTSTTELFQPQ
eukprot:364226-Chlamydomonas_euryale.AAC.1